MNDSTNNVKFKFAAEGAQQTQGAAQSVRKAFEQLDGRFSSTALSVDNVGAAFGRLSSLAGLAGGLGVAGIAAWAKSVADGVDSLNDLSDATGASIETLSGLEDAGARTGTSMDTVGTALLKLNQVLASATPGSAAENTLKAIGLSAAELRAQDPAEALQTVAKALAGYADDGEKARLVQELFGKSVREVAPLLRDLAESQGLLTKVTTEQAQAVDLLNRRWSALKKDGTDLARSVALPLVEAMNQVAGAFRDTDQYAGQLSGTAQVLAVPLQALLVLGITVADTFRGIGTELGGLAAQAAALASGNLKAVRAIRAEMVADAEAARQRYDQLTARILNLNGAQNDALRRAEDRGFRPETRGTVPGRPEASAGAAAKKAADERLKLAELTARALVDIEELAAKDAAEAWGYWEQQQMRKSKERTDATKDQWRQVFEFIDQEQEREIAAGQIAAGLKDVKTTGREVAEDLALVFSSAAGEAITNWQGVKGLLKGILQDIAQIALKKTVTEPLGKAVGGFIAGVDFGSIFKSLIPKFDTGIDYVPRDMLAYIHKGERVVPAAENRASGGRAVAVTFNLPAGASPDDWRRSQRQIEASMARAVRRGGGLA